MRKYGITLEQYDALLASQNHRCAICPSNSPKAKNGWHVDHDHKTNKVRGILCHHCNTGIGLLGHSSERLKAAATYLMPHEGESGASTQALKA
jgi:hypothetical protein